MSPTKRKKICGHADRQRTAFCFKDTDDRLVEYIPTRLTVDMRGGTIFSDNVKCDKRVRFRIP
ncbi:MAG: hypothetical protein A3H76_01125 [Candidatus Lloydbacteria bacterium RIFCSPLOWO2_02_FULL_54_12]|nr:MAG: hypothetical protein A3H76_01125 [Candidatus Lloydbacteria bacterium RIFCSPLOWO2_02_FULL_54_12]